VFAQPRHENREDAMMLRITLAVTVAAALLIGPAYAQPAAQQPAAPAAAPAPPPPEYGVSISAGDAKKAAAAAIAEHPKTGGAPMAIAIVDTGGHLVYFERMPNTQIGSVRIAIDKARSAALFRRPTKVFEDALAGGRHAILGLRGLVPSEGGVPIVIGGKIIGAIGASGGTAQQDGVVANAGVKALSQ
jgi:glc operon protein GlcG